MRNQNCTALAYFKKLQRKNHCAEILSNARLNEVFNKLDKSKLQTCEQGPQSLCQQIVSIEFELERFLQKKNGIISWDHLT